SICPRSTGPRLMVTFSVSLGPTIRLDGNQMARSCRALRPVHSIQPVRTSALTQAWLRGRAATDGLCAPLMIAAASRRALRRTDPHAAFGGDGEDTQQAVLPALEDARD